MTLLHNVLSMWFNPKCDIRDATSKGGLLSSIDQWNIIEGTDYDSIFKKYSGLNEVNQSFKKWMQTQAMMDFVSKYYTETNQVAIGTTRLWNVLSVVTKSFFHGEPEIANEALDQAIESWLIDNKDYWMWYAESLSRALQAWGSIVRAWSPLWLELVQWMNNHVFKPELTNQESGWWELNNFLAMNKLWHSSVFEFISKFMPDSKKKLMDKQERDSEFERLFWEAPVWKFTTFNSVEWLMWGRDRAGWRWKIVKWFNKMLAFTAPLLLTSSTLSPAWWVYAATAAFATQVNIYKTPKRRSSKETQNALVDLWVAHATITDHWPGTKSDNYIVDLFNNNFTLANILRRPLSTGIDDFTGKKSFFDRVMDNPLVSWSLMWVQNLIGDTIFRPRYQELAIELAMERLSLWDSTVQNYIYRVGPDWKLEKNMEAVAVLRYEYQKALSDLVGMWYEDKGTQTTWWGFNRVYSFISQWGTRHFNTTLRNLSGWQITGRVSDIVTTWYYDANGAEMMIAKSIVSDQEMARERGKLAFTIKMALRFNRQIGACENDDDPLCAIKSFAAISYLPSQAMVMAHPLVNNLVKSVGQFIEWNPFIDENTPRGVEAMEIFYKFMVRPLIRAFYALDLSSDIVKRATVDWDWFFNAARWALTQRGNNMVWYIHESVMDYTKGDNSYTPKSSMVDDLAIFWENSRWFRDAYADLIFWNKVNNSALYWDPLNSLRTNIPLLRHWMLWGTPMSDMIKTLEADEWYQALTRWEIPDYMLDNPDFMNKMYESLTKDWNKYSAKFDKNWVRVNDYNQSEISLGEDLLKEALNGKHWVSLDEYMNAVRSTYGEKEYNAINKMIAWIDNNESQAYYDFLADYMNDTKTSGVKGLALAAEAYKKKLMTQTWVRAGKNMTIQEQIVNDQMNRAVVERFWPLLYFADRKQRHDASMFYFADKYDGTNGTENYKKYFNIDKDSKDGSYDFAAFRKNTDLVDTTASDIALWAVTLSRTEMAQGNINWFQLNNVITEKLLAYNDKTDNEKRLATYVNAITYFSDVLDDLWYTDMDKTHMLLPSLSQNTELYTNMRSNPEVIKALWWADKIDKMDWILYETYANLKDRDKSLDNLMDINTFNKVVYNNKWNWYKYSNWYYPKNYNWSNTTYNRYDSIAKKYITWWSNNLKYISDWYGKSNSSSWSYSTRRNYTPREYKRLNARPRYGNVISERITTDQQKWSGTFARKTWKVKWIFGSAGIRTSWKRKVPKSFKNKIVTRWELIDGSRADRESKDNNQRVNQTQSKNRRTWNWLWY